VTGARRNTPPGPAGVHCRVAVLSTNAHLFAVTLTIARPAARQRLALPVWIPGSYLIREFAQHLQHLQATQNGEPVPLRQLDKNSWQAQADPAQALILRYEVYAFDASVRTAFLDATRGFFNNTSLCLRVIGQEGQPHTLDIAAEDLPAGWQVATGLRALQVDAAGAGRYTAADYDELVDCPVELGTFWSGAFEACGVPHRFVVRPARARRSTATRLLADARAHLRDAASVLARHSKKPPFERYVFVSAQCGGRRPATAATGAPQLHGADRSRRR
jgi:predicted metalloprotease with PDZ domain